MNTPMKVTVDAAALRQVLEALTGPSHLIRELQATRHLPELGDSPPNPINKLISEFNEQVSKAAAPSEEPATAPGS